MKKSALFMGSMAVLLWATTFSLSKVLLQTPEGVQRIGVFPYLTVRIILGLSFLYLVLIFTGKIKLLPRIFKENKKKILILGLVAFAGAYTIQYYGILYTTSANQAILLQTQTFFVAIISSRVFKNEVKKNVYLGGLIAFIGFSLFELNADLSFSGETLIGDIMTVIAAFCWGIFTAFSGEVVDKNDRISVLVLVESIGIMVFIPLALADPLKDLSVFMFSDWLILLWLGVVCMGVAYMFWYKALSLEKSQNIAVLFYFTPIFAFPLSFILRNEVISPNVVLGTVFILIGIYIAEKSGNNKKKSDKPELSKIESGKPESNKAELSGIEKIE